MEEQDIFSQSASGPPRGARDLARPSIPRPMVLAALSFVAGLVIGREALLPAWLLVASATAIACVLGLELLRTRGPEIPRPTRGATAFAALLFLGWAASNQVIRIDRRAEAIAERFQPFAITRVEGTLAEFPRTLDESIALVLRDVRLASAPLGASTVEFPLKIVVYVPRPEEGAGETLGAIPPAGSRVAAWGRLRSPRGKTHPGDFDRARYLSGRGIGATMSLKSPLDLERLAEPAGWRDRALALSERARQGIESNLDAALGESEAAMAKAILLGERGALDETAYEALRKTGVAHIVSVSGLHTMMILTLMLGLARLLWLPPRWWAAAGIAALIGYCALNGFRPPVARASVMGAFLLGAWVIGRRTSLLAALGTSAFVTLAFDPRNLMRPDWQLSYVCVASITLLAPMIYALWPPWEGPKEGESPSAGRRFLNDARRLVWLPVAVVVSIQIGLLPLHVALFGWVSLIAYFISPIVILLVFLIMAGAVALGLLGFLGSWLVPISYPLGLAVSLLDGLTQWASGFEWAATPSPAMPPWMVFLYYGVLLAGPHLARSKGIEERPSSKQRFHMALRIGFFAMTLVWLPVLARPSAKGRLELYMLDVGQGDALVVRFPGDKLAVIDGGRADFGDQGERTVAPFLEWLGVRRIDLMIATHADADHVGGLLYLVENFEVGLFIQGPDRSESEIYGELIARLGEKGIAVVEARAGDRIGGLGHGVEMEFLNPEPGQTDNNASLVILIDYNEIEMLLTGDIESGAEQAIVSRGLARDIEVLKVAHHGSASSTSEAFLRAFDPEVALISAGRNNRYGHPSPEVLERLAARGIAPVRTDTMGAVRVVTDGRGFAVEHYGR